MFKNIFLIIIILTAGFLSGWFAKSIFTEKKEETKSPFNIQIPLKKNLEVYSFEKIDYPKLKEGKFYIKDEIKKEDSFTSYNFEFEFNPSLDGKTMKKTTGQINIPHSGKTENGSDLPLVLMFRGYINQETFKTGDGTRNGAKFFAENGYITIAPDFLGYGGSDKESSDILETRFQTYITALSLLKTLELMPYSIGIVTGPKELTEKLVKRTKMYIWGHSNGGQIALTILEISKAGYPTVLWAPVTKPFPYSILYYTDQSDDKGKLIRKKLSEFENVYDIEKYSLTNYLDNINSPILLQQGGDDDAVPLSWSQDFTKELKNKEKDITLEIYQGTDHNMRPSWNSAIEKDLEFFKSH